MQIKYWTQLEEELLTPRLPIHQPSSGVWLKADIAALFDFSVQKNKRSKQWVMRPEAPLPKTHGTVTLAAAEQRAVNNLVSYFGAQAGSKAFQSPLKGCFQNIPIGSVGRNKRGSAKESVCAWRTGWDGCQFCWQCHGPTVSEICTPRGAEDLLQSPQKS